MKLSKDFIDINLAFSRVPQRPKRYVQDLIRERSEKVMRMLRDDECYVYVCGLKMMEQGVLDAFRDVCREHGADWDTLKSDLLAKNRLHIETY
jgi:benzoyl-CoA 2,3-dioxygenase component A